MIRRIVLVVAPFAVLLTLLAGGALADGDKTLTGTYPLAGAGAVRLDLPVGEIHVVAAPGAEVKVDLRVDCDHWSISCEDRAARVELVAERSPDKLEVRVEGFPKFNQRGMHVTGTITVPADRPLSIDMGVGELSVEGVGGDLRVDLGVGEVRLRLPESSVARVRLEAGVGETSLRVSGSRVEGDRSLLIGSRLAWSGGRGASKVSVDLGVGEVDARLD